MSEADLQYYARRAETAKRLADQATDPCTRVAHRQMADRYARIVRGDADSQLHQSIGVVDAENGRGT